MIGLLRNHNLIVSVSILHEKKVTVRAIYIFLNLLLVVFYSFYIFFIHREVSFCLIFNVFVFLWAFLYLRHFNRLNKASLNKFVAVHTRLTVSAELRFRVDYICIRAANSFVITEVFRNLRAMLNALLASPATLPVYAVFTERVNNNAEQKQKEREDEDHDQSACLCHESWLTLMLCFKLSECYSRNVLFAE